MKTKRAAAVKATKACKAQLEEDSSLAASDGVEPKAGIQWTLFDIPESSIRSTMNPTPPATAPTTTRATARGTGPAGAPTTAPASAPGKAGKAKETAPATDAQQASATLSPRTALAESFHRCPRYFSDYYVPYRWQHIASGVLSPAEVQGEVEIEGDAAADKSPVKRAQEILCPEGCRRCRRGRCERLRKMRGHIAVLARAGTHCFWTQPKLPDDQVQDLSKDRQEGEAHAVEEGRAVSYKEIQRQRDAQVDVMPSWWTATAQMNLQAVLGHRTPGPAKYAEAHSDPKLAWRKAQSDWGAYVRSKRQSNPQASWESGAQGQAQDDSRSQAESQARSTRQSRVMKRQRDHVHGESQSHPPSESLHRHHSWAQPQTQLRGGTQSHSQSHISSNPLRHVQSHSSPEHPSSSKWDTHFLHHTTGDAYDHQFGHGQSRSLSQRRDSQYDDSPDHLPSNPHYPPHVQSDTESDRRYHAQRHRHEQRPETYRGDSQGYAESTSQSQGCSFPRSDHQRDSRGYARSRAPSSSHSYARNREGDLDQINQPGHVQSDPESHTRAQAGAHGVGQEQTARQLQYWHTRPQTAVPMTWAEHEASFRRQPMRREEGEGRVGYHPGPRDVAPSTATRQYTTSAQQSPLDVDRSRTESQYDADRAVMADRWPPPNPRNSSHPQVRGGDQSDSRYGHADRSLSPYPTRQPRNSHDSYPNTRYSNRAIARPRTANPSTSYANLHSTSYTDQTAEKPTSAHASSSASSVRYDQSYHQPVLRDLHNTTTASNSVPSLAQTSKSLCRPRADKTVVEYEAYQSRTELEVDGADERAAAGLVRLAQDSRNGGCAGR